MKNLKVLGLASLILMFLSCGLGKNRIDCDSLVDGLTNSDDELVEAEVDKLTMDLMPESTEDDEIGHRRTFDLLIESLNEQCEGIEASLRCYACIKTFPAQTEIVINYDSSNVAADKVLDFSTPEGKPLRFIGTHH